MTDTLTTRDAGASTASASKSERAYDYIHEHIVHHQFTPGYRLVLGTIAGDLGMSVVPVREAIRRLEAEGYVTFERNVGARVAVADQAEYAFTMQTLGLVEGCAISLAAPSLRAADLVRADDLNQRMRRLLTHFDAHEFTRLNHEFHAVLFEKCPNPHILDLVHRGWRRLPTVRDSTFSVVPDRATGSVREHDDIIRLIRDHARPLDIELAARNHRWRTMDALLAARTPDTHPATEES